MLIIENQKILDENTGKELLLQGINLGGWLMMEGYILGGRNIPEKKFKASLGKKYGQAFVSRFSKRFRDSFISRKDFEKIKKSGFNCVRLPINYRLLEEPSGMNYLRKAVAQCGQHRLYAIIDMHAVPGSQNTDWHSDSEGQALFWQEKRFRHKYISLWKKIAREFKDEKWVAGYDIMNEPVTKEVGLLVEVYQEAVNLIRGVGDKHIVFLEGNNWGMEIDFIQKIKGENLAISIHFYQPYEFTFNCQQGLIYPGVVNGKKWNRKELDRKMRKYAEFAKKLGRPILAGEFGVASRCPCCNSEYQWVKDILSVFAKYRFHWIYWTYKSVKGMPLPDGLFQLVKGKEIIGTSSTETGMDHFLTILDEKEIELLAMLKTDNFDLNKPLYSVIKKHLS